jgi:hypothetical protein
LQQFGAAPALALSETAVSKRGEAAALDNSVALRFSGLKLREQQHG